MKWDSPASYNLSKILIQEKNRQAEQNRTINIKYQMINVINILLLKMRFDLLSWDTKIIIHFLNETKNVSLSLLLQLLLLPFLTSFCFAYLVCKFWDFRMQMKHLFASYRRRWSRRRRRKVEKIHHDFYPSFFLFTIDFDSNVMTDVAYFVHNTHKTPWNVCQNILLIPFPFPFFDWYKTFRHFSIRWDRHRKYQ